MNKHKFDKLSYKVPIGERVFKAGTALQPLVAHSIKRNEGIICVLDMMPSNHEIHTLEINTNSAFDDDLVEWFDFKELCKVISNWEYHNIIVLVGKKQGDFGKFKWYKELQKQVNKIHRDLYKPTVKLQVVDDVDDIWNFEYDKQNDFILRIAWDSKCIVDKLAADKRAWNRLITDFNIFADNPKYDGEGESIFEKDKWFVFKKRKIDRKNGIGIYKFDNEKDFEDRLKEFDYVESFIDADINKETGFKTEIKTYMMLFKRGVYHLTPNLYTHNYDYISDEGGNRLKPVRVQKANILAQNEVELSDGSVIKALNLNTNSVLKGGGRVTEIIETMGSSIHQKFIKINNKYDVCYSASIYCSDGLFKPVWDIEIGEELLINGKKVKVKSKDIVKQPVRTRYIKTELNSFKIDGLQISSKSDNFVLGPDKDIIWNPENNESVLSFDERGAVNGIMDGVQDQKMPDRVVEITFEVNGTFFQSEFLFEKPLKVINSMDTEIRRDRRDGREPFGTHNEAGVETDRPTFGWASYRPDLTKQIKNMEVMRLRVGMVCLTPKRQDMKIDAVLYGEFVPAKVVSMREMIGKRSHWDIYTIMPTENYFMNRMHVHNGPSDYPLINIPQVIGHWVAGNNQSLPVTTPGQISTWFDLTSRLNLDLGVTKSPPAPNDSDGTETLVGNTKIPGPQFPNFNGLIVPEEHTFAGQYSPGNPYHDNYLFYQQAPLTIIMAFSITNTGVSNDSNTQGPNPSAPVGGKFHDCGPGNNLTAMTLTPSGKIAFYHGPSYASLPSTTQIWPGGEFYPSGRAQVSKMRCFWMKTDQGPSPYFSVGFDRNPNQAQQFSYVSPYPTPQSNPRSPGTKFSLGGSSSPGPFIVPQGGNHVISNCVIYDAQLTKAEIAEQWDEWYDDGNNDQIYHEDGL